MIYLPEFSNIRSSSLRPLIAYTMLIILIFASAFAYISHIHLVVRQSDPATYFYAGLRIAKVGHPSFCDANNDIAGPYFTLLGFKIRDLDNISCFRPNLNIGFSLLIAAARLFGPVSNIAPYLTPTLALVGLVVVFALGQALFDWPTGLLAAGLLAFNSVYWTMATEMWSDVPAMTFLVLGIFFAIRMIEQDDMLQGLMSGAILGFACLIRYHSILVLLPLSVYFWFVTRGQAKPKRALVSFASSFVVLILALLVYQQLYHGGFLKTGYGAQQGEVPWPRFSISYFTGQTPNGDGGYQVILSALMENFHIVGLVVACVAVIIMPRAKALLSGCLVVTFCAFYAFYAWPTQGLNVRFLLPTFPIIYLAIAFGITRFLRRLLRQKPVLFAAMLLAVVLVWHAPSIQTTLLQLERRNRYVENRVALVKQFTQETDPDAVFMSREYHDLIILYGKRSAFLYPLVATSDPVLQNSQPLDYESRLVKVVNKLLENDIPLFFVVEPEWRTFLQGDIDPHPILSRHFEMIPFRTETDPIIYQIQKASN